MQEPHIDYVRRARLRQSTMSTEHDELMDELPKIRDIRALSRDIRQSDVEDVRRELIDKACNPEGDPKVLYERLIRACLKEDDRFAGMTPWYASDERFEPNGQRDEPNISRTGNGHSRTRSTRKTIGPMSAEMRSMVRGRLPCRCNRISNRMTYIKTTGA